MEIRNVTMTKNEEKLICMSFDLFKRFCKKSKLPILNPKYIKFIIDSYHAKLGESNQPYDVDIEINHNHNDTYDISVVIDYRNIKLIDSRTVLNYYKNGDLINIESVHSKIVFTFLYVDYRMLNKRYRKQIDGLESYKRKLNALITDTKRRDEEIEKLTKKLNEIKNIKDSNLIDTIRQFLKEDNNG